MEMACWILKSLRAYTIFTRAIGWSFETTMDVELFSNESTLLVSTVSITHRTLSIYALLASEPKFWIILCCFVAWKAPIRYVPRGEKNCQSW